MAYSVLLLGAVGVLAETSKIERRAFNMAFELNNIPWHWDAQTYRSLLNMPGEKARLAHYAQLHATHIDVEAVHDDKRALFEDALFRGVPLRPGIAELVAAAQAEAMRIGFVTADDPRQVAAILEAVKSEIDPVIFDFVGDKTRATYPKPAPDIYHTALRCLGASARDAIALEDTPESAAAAISAGVRTFAYPGAEAVDRQFGSQVIRLSHPINALRRSMDLAA